jgi:hypothetical protein
LKKISNRLGLPVSLLKEDWPSLLFALLTFFTVWALIETFTG